LEHLIVRWRAAGVRHPTPPELSSGWQLTVPSLYSQIVGGVVTDTLGISSTFGLAAAIYAALCIPAYFLVLESSYFNRGHGQARDLDRDEVDDIKRLQKLPVREPYSKRLAISRGRMTDRQFWLGSIKPLLLITSPIVAYSAIFNSLVLFLVAGVATLTSVILSAEPYNLSPTNIGLTGLPILGVVLVGGPLIGWASDASVRFMARTNGSNPGVAEPEFRLIVLFLTLPTTSVGLAGLGISIENRLPLMWVLVWLTIVSFGATAGVQVAISYLIDCHPAHSAQAFSSVNMIAALVVFAGTAPVIDWLMVAGPMTVFGSLACAAIAILVLTLPLYVFGKRIRNWYAHTKLAEYLLR
jgi:MFS family permease